MFLPSSLEITSEGHTPKRWMLMLHGIYGRGANWRSFARELAKRRPDWGFVLPDLRMHGKSKNAPPPHTLKACARDVLALIDERASVGIHVEALLGHSFGGKVALEVLGLRETIGLLWIVDSSPGPRPGAMTDPDNTVVSVLRMLQSLPRDFVSRDAFIDAVTSQGFSLFLAQWLAMNLERVHEHYQNCLEPGAMEELLSDYFQVDGWPLVQASKSPIRFAIATESSAISVADAKRLRVLEAQERGRGAVEVHEVEGSHWLHVDAFAALIELVVESLD
jgi:esterase